MNTTKLLFGPNWDLNRWTDSDDRVRGGSSESELVPSTDGVFFRGSLDIETLRGAGFASQRTVGQDEIWDLTGNDGIELDVVPSDRKRYTFSLTDEIPEQRRDGREQSALVWEYDFCASSVGATVRIYWKDLRATYRGRQVEAARPLDLSRIRRFRIMVRSFFGDQHGEFGLNIRTIGLFRDSYLDDPNLVTESMEYNFEKRESSGKTEEDQDWLLCCCPLF